MSKKNEKLSHAYTYRGMCYNYIVQLFQLVLVSSIVKPFQEFESIYYRLAYEKVVKWSPSYLNLVYPTQRINLELVHHMSIAKY